MTNSATSNLSADYEEQRLAALAAYHILDTPEDVAFDDICRLNV